MFGLNFFKDELKIVSKQINRNKRKTWVLKREIHKAKNQLFFVNGKLEQIEKENEQLENWEKTLKEKLSDWGIKSKELSENKSKKKN